ncbi:hypothetical protein [Streptomyces sp. G45]|uniref:hypothetical protein n=1 Tax=Streptomyces sp. G45 TaxID=3406627 RepID=UPI003C141F28
MHRRRFITGALGTATAVGLGSARPAGAVPRPEGWRRVAVPDGLEVAALQSVAAASRRRAWAVGAEGLGGGAPGRPLSYLWDGRAWSRTDTSGLDLDGYLTDVAANTSGEAWAIGYEGDASLWHLHAWDGDGWERVPFPGEGTPGAIVADVTVAPDGEAWAVGQYEGTYRVLRWNGRRWRWLRPLPSGNQRPLVGVRRSWRGEIWIYGPGVCARWDGTWHEIPMEDHPHYVTGLLPVAPDDIWLCGYDLYVPGGRPPTAQLRHYDGTAWRYAERLPITVGQLTGIVGDARDRPDRIAGWSYPDWNQSHYLRWDGAAWVSERGPASGSPTLMYGITRVPRRREYWAVGSTVFIPRPPGQVRIERLTLPRTAEPRDGSDPVTTLP